MPSLREAAAQCVFVRLGSNLPPTISAEDDVDRVRALLDDCPVGGLLLFRAHWPDVTDALATLQQASPLPLLVAADVERGVGQQVDGATLFPHAMAVGDGPDPEADAAVLARTTAREARAAGIHWALAPVADVHVEPRNPIINIRSFGRDPDRVVDCTSAYIRAARANGLLTSAKHLPGHGRTTEDSHATLPVIDADRSALDAVDLPPFRAAVDAGVDSLMTAHVVVPALGDAHRPATVSPSLLRTLVRDEWGFTGVVVSDSLQMEGIAEAERQDPGDDPGAARLLNAGVDVLLDPADPRAVVDGLVAAVADGRLPAERVWEASNRVRDLKRRLRQIRGPTAFAPAGRDGSGAVVGGAVHRAHAAAMSRRALQIDGDGAGWCSRFGSSGEGLVAVLLSSGSSGATQPFDRRLHALFPKADRYRLSASVGEEAVPPVRQAAQAASAVLVACFVEPAAWRDGGLSAPQHDLVASVSGQDGAAVVVFRAADGLRPAEAADLRIRVATTVPDAQDAVAESLAGFASPHQPAPS